jgi:2'-5' RNA ligase
MRAFIAIDLPDHIRSALAEKQMLFRPLAPDASWTRPEGIHITLKFLGEISNQQAKSVQESLAAIPPFPAFKLEIEGYGFFPNARRPRVFWTGVGASAPLQELAEKVESAMETLGFAREQREFAPHLTLARFREPRSQTALVHLIESQSRERLGGFEVSKFFLFESKLSPRGAQYRKIANFGGAQPQAEQQRE